MIVLIVEDEALVGLVLETALRLAGHRVLGPAFTADEALRLVDAERPELALVDINLQGDRDGVASARALRDRHGTACLFLTAQTGQAHAAEWGVDFEEAQVSGLRPWVATHKPVFVRVQPITVTGRQFVFGPEPEVL